MDFFAGSGTTPHAVYAANSRDSGNRQFISVQFPEPLEKGNYNTIAEITKERLRRAAAKLREENPLLAGDLGFRVFKLDSSNIRAWDPRPEDLGQMLLEHEEHIVAGRSEQDILYEVLLKLGLDLCVPIERRSLAGKEVYSVGGGVLMACLSDDIGRDEVEELSQGIVAWQKELDPAGDVTCIFRDSAFSDDVAKTNMAAILEQHGIENVRSL